MSNKILVIAWIIIIGGSAFIGFNYFQSKNRPIIPNENNLETNQNGNQSTSLTQTQTNQNNSQTQSPTTNQNEQNNENQENTTSLPIRPAITVTPKTFEEHLNAGDEYYSDLLLSSAVAEYKAAVKLEPESQESIIKLANAQLENNEVNAAQINFEKALEKSPNNSELKLLLAKSFLNQRNITKAREIIWELSIDEPKVKLYAAIILILNEQNQDAKNLIEELVNNEQTPSEIKEKANTILTKFIQFETFSEGEPLHLQVLLAKGLTEIEEYNASIPLLFDAITKKSNYRDAWTLLGYSYLNTGKASEAIDAFNQAKSIDPENSTILFFLGLSHFANNEIDLAIKYIEAADEAGFTPKEEINLKLGELYLIQKNYQSAAKYYQNAITNSSSSMNTFIRATWIQIDKLNHPEQALKIANRALEIHPQDPMSYNLVGWAYLGLENSALAKENLEKALSINPNLEAAYYNLGRLYEEQGQSLIAKQYYEKSLTIKQTGQIAELASARYNSLKSGEKPKLPRTNLKLSL